MPEMIACLTMARARHGQLLAQVDGLTVGSVPPDLHVVISMGDRDLTRGRLPLGTDRWRTVVRPVPTDHRALPLAAARNLAARLAVEEGADTLVFLDGGVIPGPHTLERLAEVVRTGVVGDRRPEGPVAWLAPLLDLPPVENEARGYPLRQLHDIALRAPGVPELVAGQLAVGRRWERFGAAAFAMSAADWQTVGGFAPDYTGHGLEDADFGEVLRQAGGVMVWVGDATVYRQPGDPIPLEHEVRTAVRHSKAWRQRWDEPAEHPWLMRLVGEGRLTRTRDGDYIVVKD